MSRTPSPALSTATTPNRGPRFWFGSDHTFGVCFSDTASVPLCELSFELRFSCSSRTFSRNSPTNVCQEGRLSRFSRKQSYRGRSEVEPLGGLAEVISPSDAPLI